jgi:hypothetical protein
MNKYFTVLNYKTTLSDLLLRHVEKLTDWNVTKFGNHVTYIPELIKNDPVLEKFRIKFDAECIIMKMFPNAFYRFHMDGERQCAINVLLDGYDSNCYFGDTGFHETVIQNLTEVKYERSRCVLFNTQQKHAIVNRNNNRYLLSIGCFKNTYKEIYEYCIQENLFKV